MNCSFISLWVSQLGFPLFFSGTPYIPMIPFGLKETKYIDFGDAFKVCMY